jgi:Uma2 family endonuclease
MAMPATTKRWTLEEVHSLPDDGNKYELIHEELYVTPPSSPGHDTTIARLTTLLVPYVVRNDLGLVYHPRSVIRWRGSEVEPDLMVRRAYWFLDRQYRSLRVVRPGLDDVTMGDRYGWQPAGASQPLVVDVQPLFG